MRVTPLLFALCLLPACKSDPPEIPPEKMETMEGVPIDEMKHLLGGEVVVTPRTPTGGSGISALARGVVDAPPAKVWPILRDCQHFSEFLPRTKSSRASKAADGAPLCHVEIDMPFPLDDAFATTRSVIETLPGGGFKRTWTLVKGDYHRNNGSWAVKPMTGGTRSLLEYTIDLDPKASVPDAIAQRAQASALPKVFEAVRERVKGR
jgi:ribosome-associated toxin RatA of RatAB toxin-antitoxin module